MKTQRLVIGIAGILLGLFGVYRFFTEIPLHQLMILAFWLIGAVIIHDGMLSPVVVSIGWVLAKVVPPRARRYLQGALIAGGLVTVIALPMIHQAGKEPAVKAILRQNFTANLSILLAVIATVSLLLYAAAVARDRTGTSASADPDVQAVEAA